MYFAFLSLSWLTELFILPSAQSAASEQEFQMYLSKLKHELSPIEIELCCVCHGRPLTHGFVVS